MMRPSAMRGGPLGSRPWSEESSTRAIIVLHYGYEGPTSVERRADERMAERTAGGRGGAHQLGVHELRLPRGGRASRKMPRLRRKQGDVRPGAGAGGLGVWGRAA